MRLKSVSDSVYLVDNVRVKTELSVALSLFSCDKDNFLHAELTKIYNNEKDKILDIIKPCGVFGFVKAANTILSICTLGHEISDYIESCQNNDMLRGMMVSFMADSALFNLHRELDKAVICFCKDMHVGISQSYNPVDDISLEKVKEYAIRFDVKKHIGVDFTKGYMLNPVKSGSKLYITSDNVKEYNVLHSCKSCDNMTCQMRMEGA